MLDVDPARILRFWREATVLRLLAPSASDRAQVISERRYPR
jgi:hypothetical protein